MTASIAKVIWGIGCISYYIIRFPHQRRSRKTPVANRLDRRRERTLMAVSFSGLFLVPLIYVLTDQPEFANYTFHAAQGWLGAVFLVGGMTLLYRTHRDLGRAWSITLEVRDQHKMITHGIYERLRHPMYASFWLWAISQAFLLPNWVAGLSGLAGFGTLFFARVYREEDMMIEKFGEEYRSYMKRTHRLIPGIY